MAPTLRRFGRWINDITMDPVVFFMLVMAVVFVGWLIWPKTYTVPRVLQNGACYEVRVTESFGGLMEHREIISLYRGSEPCR